MIFKRFLFLFLFLSFEDFVYSELFTKISGSLNFRSVYSNCREPIIQNNRSVFVSNAKINVEVSNITDDYIQYGGNIMLSPLVYKFGIRNNSYIFVNGNFGKIQVGSFPRANLSMIINALNILKGNERNWNDRIYIESSAKLNSCLLDFWLLDRVSILYNNFNEYSNNITYYTPKYNGLYFGISYIPYIYGSYKEKYIKNILNSVAKDIISLGISYEYNFSDGIDLKASLTGEVGKIFTKRTKEKLITNKLKGYNIGAILNYGNFSYIMSYGGYRKNVFIKEKDSINMYSTGITYSQGPIGLSLTYYLNTDNRKKKIQAVTLGTEYKLTEGLLSYAELSKINSNDDCLNDKSSLKKNKATVFVLGLKLSFEKK